MESKIVAYTRDGYQKTFKQEVTRIRFWENRQYTNAPLNLESVTKLLTEVKPLHMPVIKPDGELHIDDNPFFIYGETWVNLLTVDGQIVYNRYKGNFADSIAQHLITTAQAI